MCKKKYWVKIRKCAQKSLSSGLKDSFIKWAVNCQLAVVSFAGKRRLVSRGVVSSSRMKKMKMHKYASNTNTNTQSTHRKTRNTQLQKYRHTQIQISLSAVLARSEEEKKMRFSEKSVLTKLAVTSVPEYFQKLPACQNEALLQG